MSKRFSPNIRLLVYQSLCLRDGEKCAACGKVPDSQLGNCFPGVSRHPNGGDSLDIHHCDGNPKNNEISNLKLLCHKCNTSISNKQRSRKINVSVCERKSMQTRLEGQPATRIVREVVDYSTGDTAMQANNLYELPFREWVLQQVREHGYISKTDAINAGAEIVGCSTETARRYLDKLTSLAGSLREEKDLLGTPMVTWRNDPLLDRDEGKGSHDNAPKIQEKPQTGQGKGSELR